MKSVLEYSSRRLGIVLRFVHQYSGCLPFKDLVRLHFPTLMQLGIDMSLYVSDKT